MRTMNCNILPRNSLFFSVDRRPVSFEMLHGFVSWGECLQWDCPLRMKLALQLREAVKHLDIEKVSHVTLCGLVSIFSPFLTLRIKATALAEFWLSLCKWKTVIYDHQT